MKSYQEQLLQLLPPPSKKYYAEGNWEESERKLGTPLPTDYKWFITNYGSGTIGTKGSDEPYLWVLSLFRKSDSMGDNLGMVNLRSYYEDGTVKGYYKDGNILKCGFPPLFPEPGGLLAFAGTGTGQYLYWRTEGTPDQWPVVIWDTDFLRLWEIPSTLSEFLVDLVTRKGIVVGGESLTGEGWLDEPDFVPGR
jgi:hypothetical protein